MTLGRNNPKTIVLAAGGTGGHVFPAEALAKALVARGLKVVFMTDDRGGIYKGMPEAVDIHQVASSGIAGKSIFGRAKSIPQLALGCLQAGKLLRGIHPALVVGFGGYASLPPLVAANWLKFPTLIHEQNAILGRANRLLAARAKGIATSFAKTDLVPETAISRVRLVGMPVRDSIIAARSQSYPDISDESPLQVLVMGGSQGARILSQVVPDAITQLPDQIKARLTVVQQCRPEDLSRVIAHYKDAGIKAELKSFFDDIPNQLAKAHVLISRSGASSAAEALVVGRPAVLVPYAHAIDDHQSANAHAVDHCGAGWLMEEASFTADSLKDRLVSLFTMPKTLRLAAENARANGLADAAERLADMVADLAGANGNGGIVHKNKSDNEEAA